MIGSDVVAKAAPDGYTLMQAAAHIRAEMARWDRVLKAAAVQPN